MVTVENKSEAFTKIYLPHIQKTIDKVKDLEIFKDAKWNIHHYSNVGGLYFTNNEDYFSCKVKLFNAIEDDSIFSRFNSELGAFTISCFPHCCGACIITADYGSFGRYGKDRKCVEGEPFLLLAMHIAARYYRNAFNADSERNASNLKAYEKCGFTVLNKFEGRHQASLFLAGTPLVQDENYYLNKLISLYGKEESGRTETPTQDQNQEQASQPSEPEEVISESESTNSFQVGIYNALRS